MQITVDVSRMTKTDADKRFVLELPDGSTIEDLKSEVTNKFPHIDVGYVLILVNDELVYTNRVLVDDNVVKIFPPVMGG